MFGTTLASGSAPAMNWNWGNAWSKSFLSSKADPALNLEEIASGSFEDPNLSMAAR